MKSMTGFGKATQSNELYELTVELRSVNNRYLDLTIRLPREFSVFENVIREQIKKEISRGKVQVYVNLEKHEAQSDAVVNPALAQKLYSELQTIHQTLGLEEPVRLSHLLAYLPLAESDSIRLEDDAFKALLEPALRDALTQLNAMRAAEGAHLKRDMEERIALIAGLTEDIKSKAGGNVQETFDRLLENIRALIGAQKLDETRLEQEIALISDKVDITEECVRMDSHLHLFRQTLEKQGETGKKLTFILQEMLREANTMNSKNANVAIQHQVIRVKEEIEKIREQAQNLE